MTFNRRKDSKSSLTEDSVKRMEERGPRSKGKITFSKLSIFCFSTPNLYKPPNIQNMLWDNMSGYVENLITAQC